MHGRSKVKNRAGERLRQRVEFFEPGRKLRDTDFRRRSSPPGRTGMIRLSISGHDLLVVTRLLSRIRSLNRCLGEKFSRRVSRGLESEKRRRGGDVNYGPPDNQTRILCLSRRRVGYEWCSSEENNYYKPYKFPSAYIIGNPCGMYSPD